MVEFPLRPADADGGPDAAPPARRGRRRLLRAVAWALCVLAALFAVFALKLSRGLPERWAERIGETLSTDDVDIELSRVSFSLADLSLRVGSLGVYRKRVLREPVARAGGVSVRFRPRGLVPSAAWLRSVRADSLSLDIDVSGGGGKDPEEDSSGPVAIPELPPVSVSCGRVSVLGLSPRNVEATVFCTNGVLRVADARVAFPEEKAAGQAVSGSFFFAASPLALGADASGKLDPNVVAPLLRLVGEPEIAAELEKFAFPAAAPDIDARYRYCPDRRERSLRIRAGSGPARYNGVEVDAFDGVVEVGSPDSWSRVSISPLNASRPEGSASAALEILPAADELRFRASATMDPVRLAGMIGIVDAGAGLPVSFPEPVQLRGSGVFAIGSDATNALSVSAFAPEVAVAGVSATRASVRLSLAGDVLSLRDVRADVLGGDLTGSFSLSLPFSPGAPTNFPATLSLSLSGLRHAEIAQLLGSDAVDSKGRVDADLRLEGPLQDAASLAFAETTGALSVDARETRVFRIPVFAGLTDILAAMIPGVDFLVDEDNLSVRGVFGNGKLRVDSFKIDGAAVSLSGKGDVVFPDCDLDLKVKVHLLNRSTWLGEGVYWLLSPISKILEIRATGPASSPRWTSATFQSNPSKK